MEKISLSDFKKIDLRVAKIKSAEKVEGSDTLLKIILDVGSEEKQIVAGIAKYYKIDELIDKKIIFVSNLEPKNIKGIESNGMLLAAKDADKDLVVLLTVDKDIKSGAQIS